MRKINGREQIEVDYIGEIPSGLGIIDAHCIAALIRRGLPAGDGWRRLNQHQKAFRKKVLNRAKRLARRKSLC
jgi:hypothetical protein